MYYLKIYGEIVPFTDKWVVSDGYCNLIEVQRQLAIANGDDICVRINSNGGDVVEGFAIYSELRRYAAANNAKIETFAEGRCDSIATVIFLAGDTRIVNEFVEPFVHNAWTYAVGDNREILRVAADLEKCNDMIARHYAAHTELTYSEARALMDGETSITPDECVSLRFATSIEYAQRPVALRNILKSKTKKMAKNRKKMSLAKSVLARLGFSNLTLFTADQNEVDFYELEDGDEPQVGDKATIDGQPAGGEVVMADGATLVFEAGTLTEIISAEGADGTVEEQVADIVEDVVAELTGQLQEVIADNKKLKESLKALKNKIGNARSSNLTQSGKVRVERVSDAKFDVANSINKLMLNKKAR